MSLDDLLPWGLTWGKLHEAAHLAAAVHHSRLLDYDARHEAALDEIVLAVAEADGPLSWRTLMNAGIAGINTAVKAEIHHHGLGGSGRTGRRFAMFWHGTSPGSGAPFEEPVLERLTLAVVWACLDDGDRDVLWATAQYNTAAEAAAAVGKPVNSYWARLSVARARARALWADWEPPIRHYSKNTPRRGGAADPARLLRQRVSHHRRAA